MQFKQDIYKLLTMIACKIFTTYGVKKLRNFYFYIITKQYMTEQNKKFMIRTVDCQLFIGNK